MKKNFIFSYQSFIIILSLSFWIYLLGFDFIRPTNIEWLYHADLAANQLGWQFFRDDLWRFPFGANPNYGIYYDGSIVFSDSIPIFALFFKTIKIFLPDNFQYFSIWILLCIYLQIFFSFKILFKFTNDITYSLIGSLFFIFSTILIQRSGIHFSLMGQWIILFYLYFEIKEDKNKIIFKLIPILLSVLIHFYFTIILLLFFLFQRFYDLLNRNLQIKKTIIQFVIISLSTIFLMYVAGYFTINLDDGLGWGYGNYNYNLNSFFNPTGINNIEKFNWSKFLPLQKLQNGEYEGFSYLGVTGILFLLLFVINFFYKKYEIIFSRYKLLLISTLFIMLATSNNINYGEIDLLQIPLNNYIYALLSSIRASGRLIWLVYYLIFIFGIIFIFKIFEKRKPRLILLLLLLIQIIDISPGISKYSLGSQYITKDLNFKIKGKKWDNLSINFEQIRVAEPKNQSQIYNTLSRYILNQDFKKTDITYLARVNREAIILERYKLVKIFNQKNEKIFIKTIFVSDNINFVRNLYNIYKNKLHYYYTDDIWMISALPLNHEKTNYETTELSAVYEINLDIINKINFSEKKVSPVGMGWINNKKSNDLTLDGFFASIFFKANGENCKNDSGIKLKINKFYKQFSKSLNLRININKKFSKSFLLQDSLNNEVVLNFDCTENEVNEINFTVDNPQSLYDLKEGLSREKRSIILKSFEIVS